MTVPTREQLVHAIADAARAAIAELFASHADQRFYYCSLITTGEAHAPTLSAWSEETLAEASRHGAVDLLRWSYADSPFCNFEGDRFADVRRLFLARPALTSLSREQREQEYGLRLDAMEAAMARLDGEGLFGRDARRSDIVVLVEVMPPDWTNTERAKRLNPPTGRVFQQWLAEAAEPEPKPSAAYYRPVRVWVRLRPVDDKPTLFRMRREIPVLAELSFERLTAAGAAGERLLFAPRCFAGEIEPLRTTWRNLPLEIETEPLDD